MKKLLLGLTVVTAVAVVSSFLLLTPRRQSKPSERLRDRIYTEPLRTNQKRFFYVLKLEK